MIPSRNSPCPCGSGKKYKHCHGAEGSALPAARNPASHAAASALLRDALKHHEKGDLERAEAFYRQVVGIDPRNAQALNYLGALLVQQGRLAEGEKLLRSATEIDPRLASAYCNLGTVLQAAGRFEEAVAALDRAIDIKPDFARALGNLGAVLKDLGRLEEGEAAIRRALAVEPRFADAHSNLGAILMSGGRLGEALAALDNALAINPGSMQAHFNRAGVLKEQGLVEESIAAWRRAVALDAKMPEAHSNMLLSMHYSDALGAQAIFAEHRAYDAAHARALMPAARAHANDPDPRRRLRIGYVSPDLRRHSVAYFVEPVLEQHDSSGFEIACYHNNPHEDEVSARLRQRAALWTNCSGMSDQELVRRIAEDRIDILVDLAGHTGGRMLAFARKPSPVQATWLGYPASTGLTAIDYRIADGKTDPDGYEAMCSERLIRLPDSYFCYRPPEEAPGPVSSAAHGTGIVFGSFNHIAKVTTATVELWVRVLGAVPGSKLLLKTRGFSDESVRQRILTGFAGHGIATSRIDLLPWEQGTAAHLETYAQVDVALDTTPYNGATTTCEALWMGVPVVSLAGSRSESRMGLSILGAAGFQEWVAHSEDEFVAVAARLAGDARLRQRLRQGLRGALRASPLLDGSRFTRSLEAAYRQMWAAWCAAQSRAT